MNKNLIEWSKQYYSHLPWRLDRTLYTTLVSEIMLQQTTVGTVLNHFKKFIEKYPSIESLALASEEQILIDWKGLGYYRRAKNLLKAAKKISEDYNNNIPLDYEKLINIPGIGDYTASAILAIGEDRETFAIDANIERVLSRIFSLEEVKGKKLNERIKEISKSNNFKKMFKEFGGRDVNESLMDLGRSLCKARSVNCEICPVQNICQSRDFSPLTYPKVNGEKKSQKLKQLNLLRVVCIKNNQILVYKKDESKWLGGQYEVPTFTLYSEDETLNQYPPLNELDNLLLLPSFKTFITNYKIENHILFAEKKDCDFLDSSYNYRQIKGLNLSTASQKAIEFL